MIYKNFTKLISLLSALKILKLFKIVHILGTKALFFSYTQAVAPISGFFFNYKLNILVYISRIFIFMLNGINPILALLHHMPSFCGSLYLNTKSRILKIIIPVFAILLFLNNSDITKSDIITKLYCLYFAVPILLNLINNKFINRSIFFNCLASTFTTHAVGSILWLYTHKFDQTLYHKLITIVWAERLLFAAIMTTAIHAIQYFSNQKINDRLKSFKTKVLYLS